jgi:hypothetical protein
MKQQPMLLWVTVPTQVLLSRVVGTKTNGYRLSLAAAALVAVAILTSFSWVSHEIGPVSGSTRTLPHDKTVAAAVGSLYQLDDDPVHPETVTFQSFDIPKEPFLRAQTMVEESIGPSILNDETLNPLRNCSATTQYRLMISSSPTVPWKLQALYGPDGHEKTYGGDEMYVQWQAHRDKNSTDADNLDLDMGIALVTDGHDGTYTLDFVTPPLVQDDRGATKPDTAVNVGILTIYYDYTCGIGSLLAPQKERYARAGEVHTSWNHSDIPRPSIRSFDVPNIDRAMDLSRYDKVYGFGDSLMMQFVRRYKANVYWHPNLLWVANVNQALSDANETQSMLAKLREYHGAHLQDAAVMAADRNHSVAVIVGSSVWDVMGAKVRPGLQAHLDACRSFVTQAQIEFPHVDFYWKSPSAIFLHRRRPLIELGTGNWLRIAKYTSGSVPRMLHVAQKELMREMNIPYLDLFEAYHLSAPWSLEGDCRHYNDRISKLLLSYYWPGLT